MTDLLHEQNLIEFTLSYPVANGTKPVLLGAVLALLGVTLIVPFIILAGYAYRLGRAAARGDPTPPDYDDWTGLLRDGTLLLTATLPPFIVLAILLTAVISIARTIGTPAAMVTGVFASGALILAGTYLSFAALPTIITTGSVTKTYHHRMFLRFALTYPYFKGFVFIVVAHLVVSTIASFLFIALVISLHSAVIVLPLYLLMIAYVTYAYTALWGYVCWDARPTIILPPVESTDPLTATF